MHVKVVQRGVYASGLSLLGISALSYNRRVRRPIREYFRDHIKVVDEPFDCSNCGQSRIYTSLQSIALAFRIINRILLFISKAVPLMFKYLLSHIVLYSDKQTNCIQRCIQFILPQTLCHKSILYSEFAHCLVEMGPTYIKLGQWAASRSDIFTREFVQSLSFLFDQTPSYSLKNQIKSSGLDKKIHNVSKSAINSGSVAQVYTANLNNEERISTLFNANYNIKDLLMKNGFTSTSIACIGYIERLLEIFNASVLYSIKSNLDHFYSNANISIIDLSIVNMDINLTFNITEVIPANTKVAVKILHPNVFSIIETDLLIFKYWAQILNFLPGFDCFSLTQSVDEFSRHLLAQLNLLAECNNMTKFRFNFMNDPDIIFPMCIRAFSSWNILVETFEEGLPAHRVKPEPQLAHTINRMFLKMLFTDNFIHSDLHPGNILIQHHGAKSKIVVLDGGLTTSLAPRDRENFISLISALIGQNGRLGAELIIERSPYSTCSNKEHFISDMDSIFSTIFNKSNFSIGDIE